MCGDAIGVSDSAIQRAERKGSLCQSIYRVVRRKDEHRETEDKSIKEAVKSWDEFCEPIRKKYGIPVYKPPKKEW